MIIAIDGSAGSGKGSLAKNLSTKLNLMHLDTGVLFRIIASQAIDLGIPDEDEHLKELSRKLTIENVEKIKVTEKEKYVWLLHAYLFHSENSFVSLTREGMVLKEKQYISYTFYPIHNPKALEKLIWIFLTSSVPMYIHIWNVWDQI